MITFFRDALSLESSLPLGVGEVLGAHENPRGWKGANKGKVGGGAPACREPPGMEGRRHFVHTCPVHHVDCSRLEVRWGRSNRHGGKVELNARGKRELTFLLLLLVAASWEMLEVRAGRVSG